MKQVKIISDYIKLGQFLKFEAIIDSGAQAKEFLEQTKVLVNGNPEDRRGRKLFKGDIIEINKIKYEIITE